MREAIPFVLQHPIEHRPAGTGSSPAIAGLERGSVRRSLDRCPDPPRAVRPWREMMVGEHS